jgi:hypothetical protein
MPEALAEIERAVEDWAAARLTALAAEAEEVAAEYYAGAAQERARRPRSQWGRLGVRVRAQRSARAAPGAFAIEWFTRRWVNRTPAGAKTFTVYLRRGGGDRYPPGAFAGAAEPWELALAEALEARFAAIRRLARGVSRVRMAFRLHAKLERALAGRCGMSDGDGG